MLVRVICFIISLFLVIVFTLADFDNLLNKGEDKYIQRYSGMLNSCILLMIIPPLVFGLMGEVGVWITCTLEVVYITIYTWIYFKIRKIKEERKNNEI